MDSVLPVNFEHLTERVMLFVLVMALVYKNGYLGVTASVLFVYACHLLLIYNHRKVCKEIHANGSE